MSDAPPSRRMPFRLKAMRDGKSLRGRDCVDLAAVKMVIDRMLEELGSDIKIILQAPHLWLKREISTLPTKAAAFSDNWIFDANPFIDVANVASSENTQAVALASLESDESSRNALLQNMMD